jgi:small-conductance mechanosensitive channel
VGDRVIFDGRHAGIVEEFGFRTTKVRTDDGNLIIVPNSDIRVITLVKDK